MALFISQLAFAGDPALLAAAKLGILISSVIAAFIGLLWLLLFTTKRNV